MVEHLVGYAKRDLMVPQQPFDDHRTATARPPCGALRSTRPPMPRFVRSRPSGWPSSSHCWVCCRRCGSSGALGRSARKVDRLSCVRFGLGPLLGAVPADRPSGHHHHDRPMIVIVEPITGEVLAEHRLVAPGETSILDAHYGGVRPDRPSRAPRARTQTERDFLALGPVAEAFLVGAAAAGVSSCRPNWPTSPPCRRRTAPTPCSPLCAGPWSSAAGEPPTSAPSCLRAAPRRPPPGRAGAWSSPCRRCRPDR